MAGEERDDEERQAPADIEIGAVAKAKKIRFETKPETDVSFPGSAPSSYSHTERKNLPDEVEPGVTYRDIEVRWKARADVEAELSELARGESPRRKAGEDKG